MPKVQKQHQPSIDCADAVLHDANVKHPRDINAPAPDTNKLKPPERKP